MTRNSSPPSQVTSAELSAYLDGECSDEVRMRVESWLHAAPGRAQEFTQLRRAWEAKEYPEWDGEAFWNTIGPKLSQTQPTVSQFEKTHASTVSSSPRKSRDETDMRRLTPSDTVTRSSRGAAWYSWRTFTAASALLVAASFLLFSSGIPSRASNISQSASVYTTNNGERATVTLLDGSIVTLNVGSRLEVPANYAAGERTLHLTGEALFKVVHHNGAPFTVVTTAGTTRVLGTSFVVRHYSDDSIAVVAVRDGKVSVHSASGKEPPVIVAARQQAMFSRTHITSVGAADSTQFGFASGILTVESRTLKDVIPQLDRWYNADIRLGSPELASLAITADFAAGSLSDLASILEMLYDLRVVRVGRVLTLYAK